MGEFVAPLEVVVGLIVLFGLILSIFVVRRFLLTRNPATFDCSLRFDRGPKPAGWMLGVARYEEDSLDWWRIFSASPRANRILERSQLDLVEWREASEPDVHSILADAVIVRCSYAASFVELAMAKENYTQFVTWLESAPPGQQPFES